MSEETFNTLEEVFEHIYEKHDEDWKQQFRAVLKEYGYTDEDWHTATCAYIKD